ncbi:MAG TPA: hypothetical protein VHP14_22685 [Anaerolineales bacterium]|nr:hypothetical protein [Anaerolineales bacterium]
MSYQEKNITVSLVSGLLIGGYYLVSLLQMYQEGDLVSTRVFSLCAIVIVATIIVNIISSILTNIILSIVHAIKTRTNENERFIEDERDKLIELKGVQASYITFSIGVLLSVLAFAFGQPPLLMVSLIVLAGIVAEIIGDISQIYLYRRGF